MLLFSTHRLVWQRSCFFRAYPFVVGFPTTPFDPSPKDASSSSFVAEVGIFFSILLSQLSIFYSFVPEALWCCSLLPIFLFCHDSVLFFAYPFNRSVVFSFELSHLIKFCIPSQTECCPNYIILNPSLSWLNRSGFNIYLALQPQGFFRNVLCPSFLTECFRPYSPSLYSFLEFVQPLKVLWFHSFAKEAT